MSIATVTSLIAGLLNADSGVFQRKGIGNPDPVTLYSKQQITTTCRNKLWQIGAAAEGLAALLELVALYYGSLLLVEPLLMSNLIFLLVIVHFRLKSRVTSREWLGIISIGFGISLFLIIANPRGGQATYGLSWLIPITIIAALISIGALYARQLNNPKLRGSVGALIGGLSLGLTAALTRLVMVQLHYGIKPELTHWPLYTLIVSSIVSILTIQVGYGSGPLTITQSILEITSPLVSILLGLTLFGDYINRTPLAMALESIGFVIAIAGVITLSTSKRIVNVETRAVMTAYDLSKPMIDKY